MTVASTHVLFAAAAVVQRRRLAETRTPLERAAFHSGAAAAWRQVLVDRNYRRRCESVVGRAFYPDDDFDLPMRLWGAREAVAHARIDAMNCVSDGKTSYLSSVTPYDEFWVELHPEDNSSSEAGGYAIRDESSWRRAHRALEASARMESARGVRFITSTAWCRLSAELRTTEEEYVERRARASKAYSRAYAAEREARHPFPRKIPERLRQEVVAEFERGDKRCAICRRVVKGGERLAVDHIRELAAGGQHERANLRVVHFSCNARRGGLWGR